MRVLLLSRYGRRGASSRLRYYQYLPFLREIGIEVVPAPFFNAAYLESIVNAKKKNQAFSILFSYGLRFWNLLRHRSIDLIWIEYEVFPWLPLFIEKRLLKSDIPIVVDYDDAIFHKYDLSNNHFVRMLLGKKIAKIMRHARTVVAGNQYLGEYALSAGSKDVVYLPTVIDLNRYPFHEPFNDEFFKVGWIGSPTTSKYLNLVQPVMEKLNEDGNVRIIIIGGGDFYMDGIPNRRHRWSERTEAAAISEFDVGIMPLPDNPWERGKCGYKLIQYMACGKPVVASPVGVNREIVEHGVNGFLAKSKEEWLMALTILRDHPDLRAKMGKAGRKKVEKKYSLQTTAPELISIFKKLQE
jgi:glycosyltransferase involved in cell wall biosynthesis